MASKKAFTAAMAEATTRDECQGRREAAHQAFVECRSRVDAERDLVTRAETDELSAAPADAVTARDAATVARARLRQTERDLSEAEVQLAEAETALAEAELDAKRKRLVRMREEADPATTRDALCKAAGAIVPDVIALAAKLDALDLLGARHRLLAAETNALAIELGEPTIEVLPTGQAQASLRKALFEAEAPGIGSRVVVPRNATDLHAAILTLTEQGNAYPFDDGTRDEQIAMAMQGTLVDRLKAHDRIKKAEAERGYESAEVSFSEELERGPVTPETARRMRIAIANLSDPRRRQGAEQHMRQVAIAQREAAQREYGAAKAAFLQELGGQDTPETRARIRAAEERLGVPPDRRIIRPDAA